ncbi:cytochrome P450 [Plectosphaerella plurivora]|uniref:Cytochrome P450 n=1 Tax=Plectosphaerella plurivora TaxID=936078 RepID=A0A9P8V1D4_9PEZI|nr:cytochrome P450 [Plectosphaerella plurivora]
MLSVFLSDGQVFQGLLRPGVLAILISTVVGISYTVYRIINLRRPIQGIPYNQKAARHLLGDVPEFLAAADGKTWWAIQGLKHKSPIVQIFMRPFGRPWVVITDPLEAVDICLRRTKEFDRSDETAAFFHGVMPLHHVCLKTLDPQFKKNRDLVNELMAPSFTHEVAAPQIYQNVMSLMTLFEKKVELSKSLPFDASEDIHQATLDTIMGVSFGLGDETSQISKKIASLAPKIDETHQDRFEFEPVGLDPELRAFTVLADSLAIAIESPAPGIHHFLYRNLSPTMRQAAASRDRIRARETKKSIERKLAGRPLRCALDQVLAREDAIAEREGRKPDYNSKIIFDELMGFLIGGHETMSSILRWGPKFINDDQRVQATLRKALHEAYPQAKAEARVPTLTEILKTQVPYLEATIEEIMRYTMPSPTLFRDTIIDSEILGYKIPKGTTLLFLANGPGFMMPSVPVSEEKYRNAGSAQRGHIGTFDDSDITKFLPERWLKTRKSGKGAEEVFFDANAGPALAFGVGPRACFGKRLALVQIRIYFTLLIWSFELQGLPPQLAAHEDYWSLSRIPKHVYLNLRKAAF